MFQITILFQERGAGGDCRGSVFSSSSADKEWSPLEVGDVAPFSVLSDCERGRGKMSNSVDRSKLTEPSVELGRWSSTQGQSGEPPVTLRTTG